MKGRQRYLFGIVGGLFAGMVLCQRDLEYSQSREEESEDSPLTLLRLEASPITPDTRDRYPTPPTPAVGLRSGPPVAGGSVPPLLGGGTIDGPVDCLIDQKQYGRGTAVRGAVRAVQNDAGETLARAKGSPPRG